MAAHGRWSAYLPTQPVPPIGMSTSPVGQSCISFAAGCISATENRPPRSGQGTYKVDWSLPRTSVTLATLRAIVTATRRKDGNAKDADHNE